MRYETAKSSTYTPIWKKYRPVILQLMKKALGGSQESYTLSKHEFDDLNPGKNTTYSFTLSISGGMRANLNKKSLLADDLVSVLKGSEKAWEMIDAAEFTFELDRQFVFHVSAIAKVEEKEDEPVDA